MSKDTTGNAGSETDRDWIDFQRSVPSRAHANDEGQVEALMNTGERRAVQWDWIPPDCDNAGKVWVTNGFIGWRPPRHYDEATFKQRAG